MTELEFIFDDSPVDTFLGALTDGDSIQATRLLAVMEEMSEEQTQELFLELSRRHITLDIGDLPQYPAEEATAQRLRQEQQWIAENNLTDGPGENDPLGLYLRELAQIPAAGDVQVMAMELAAGNTDICERLVNCMLSRVVTVAQEYAGMGVLLLDLIQEGSLGLWQGLQSYTRGDIESYCDWWIRQYLSAAVITQAANAGMGQYLRQAMEDYRSVDEKLLAELGRNPTVEEIAEAMHITPEQAQTVENMVRNARAMHRAHQPEPEDLPQEEDQAVEDTAYFQMRQRIAELLSGLSETDAKILTLRYGLEGGLPMDARQVGEKLGLTANDVNEREAAALQKLRQ